MKHIKTVHQMDNPKSEIVGTLLKCIKEKQLSLAFTLSFCRQYEPYDLREVSYQIYFIC